MVYIKGPSGIYLAAAPILLLLTVTVSPAQAGSIGIVPEGGCIAYTSPDGASALFCDADFRQTGTGNFDPFLRTYTGGTTNTGWNTGTSRPSWEQPNDAGDSWTSALALAGIGTVLLDGSEYGLPDGSYRTFAVDVNGSGADSLLHLTHFELFNCASGDYSSLSSCSSFLNLFPDGTWITFDARQHSGSGSGDIIVYVLDTGFAGPYVALQDGWTTSRGGGFQEWAALPCAGAACGAPAGEMEQPGGTLPGGGTPGSGSTSGEGHPPGGGTAPLNVGGEDATVRQIPEPATILLLGSGLALALRPRFQRQRSTSDR